MDIVTLVLTIALLIVISLILHYRRNEENEKSQRQKRIKTIPGLGKEQSKQGTFLFPDMTVFIKDLHKKYGPIVSFYQNDVYAVSIADPELLKPLRQLENTPSDLFKLFELLVGPDAFVFHDLEEIRRRRKLYDHHFMLKGCKSYAACFVEIANEYNEEWKKLGPGNKIPLLETALDATMKAILRTSYGEYFKNDESRKRFQTLFLNVTTTMEKGVPEEPHLTKLNKEVEEINTTVRDILRTREKNSDPEKTLFIDVLLDDSPNGAEDALLGDSILFIQGGFDVTGKTIMWVLYELAAQPHIQDKFYTELKSVLGDNDVSLEVMPKLQYLNQIVEETIRYRLNNVFTARKIYEDLTFGDYMVPANSLIFQNFGVIMQDEKYYHNPEKFDPDHFSPENVKARHTYAWKPFGYAGRRQCPGQSYAKTKICFFVAEWCKKFRFTLAPDQNKLEIVNGFLFRPKEEIWVSLEPRN